LKPASVSRGEWSESAASGRALWATAAIGVHAVALTGLMQFGLGEHEPAPAQVVRLTLVAAAEREVSRSSSPLDLASDTWLAAPPRIVFPIPPIPPLADQAMSDPRPSAAAPPAEEPVAHIALAAPLASADSGAQAPKRLTTVSYLRPPQVVYPAVSRRMNEQGRVVVRVLIDAEGKVLQVELDQPSLHLRLNEAALRAAREALYRPHVEDGVPQAVWALVPIVFELRS
jgi:protein TonB